MCEKGYQFILFCFITSLSRLLFPFIFNFFLSGVEVGHLCGYIIYC